MPHCGLKSRQAHILFGLQQKGADVRDFAMEFLTAAVSSGFNAGEFTVLFDSCLDEPLKLAESRMLRPYPVHDGL